MNSAGTHIKKFYPINTISLSILIESFCYRMHYTTTPKSANQTMNFIPVLTPLATIAPSYIISSSDNLETFIDTTNTLDTSYATIYSYENTTSNYESQTNINYSISHYSSRISDFPSTSNFLHKGNANNKNQGVISIISAVIGGALLLFSISVLVYYINYKRRNKMEMKEKSDEVESNVDHESDVFPNLDELKENMEVIML